MFLSHNIFNGVNSIEILSLIQSFVLGSLLVYHSYSKKIPSLYLGLFILYDGLSNLYDTPFIDEDFYTTNYIAFIFSNTISILYWLFSMYVQKITATFFKKWTGILFLLMLFEIVFYSFIYFFYPSFSYSAIFGIIQLIILTLLFSCILILLYSLKRHKKLILNQYSETSQNSLQWLYDGFLFWMISSFLIIFAGLIFSYYEATHALSFVEFIVYAIDIFFIFYLYFFGAKQKKITYLFKKDTPASRVNTEHHTILITSLKPLIEKEKLYLNKGLTINEISSKINIPSSVISTFINQHYNTNFNSFINEFRINLAKKYLIASEYKNYTIEAISKECGFKSKTSFYTAFKKITGQTPSQFKKSTIQ